LKNMLGLRSGGIALRRGEGRKEKRCKKGWAGRVADPIGKRIEAKWAGKGLPGKDNNSGGGWGDLDFLSRTFGAGSTSWGGLVTLQRTPYPKNNRKRIEAFGPLISKTQRE